MANLPILPRDLPDAVEPLQPTDVFIVDQGAGALVSKVKAAPIVDLVAPLASEAESQIGTNNSSRMSPLRTKQAIASEVGVSIASYAAGQAGLSAVQTVNGKSGNSVTLNKADIGLGNVDNTSDANKPVSTAQLAALNLKANNSVVISGADGLIGGGALTDNRSISLSPASIASLALADSAVQPTITISAGAGLTGGGTLAANRTIALSSTSIASLAKADSAVQPAVLNDYATLVQLAAKFDNPSGTTAQYIRGDGSLATFPAIPQGTVTSVGLTAPTGLSVSGSPVTSTGTLALTYATGYQGYTTAESTKLAGLNSANYAPVGRTITAGTGLSGGGDLSANRTIALSTASIASLALADSAVQPAGLTKAAVGLGNVDNTSDAAKPISTATQTALNAKANSAITITAGTGLTGGGNITANRTVALSAASIASLAKADTATQPSDLGALATKDKVSIPDIDATGTANNGTFLRGDGTWATVAGAGTVTSVAMTVPTGLSVAGSPITGAGTFAVTYATGYQGYTTAEATKLSGIAAGAQVNVPQVQTDWNATSGVGSILNKPTLGTAASQNSTAFATAAQGAKADTAVQPSGLTKAAVGLGNVDNTSDANKPISTATQTALNGKLPTNGTAADSAKLGNETAAQWQAKIDAKAGVSDASAPDEVNFPIGHPVLVWAGNTPVNSELLVRLSTSDSGSYVLSGTGAALTGVYRNRGKFGTGSNNQTVLCTRAR